MQSPTILVDVEAPQRLIHTVGAPCLGINFKVEPCVDCCTHIDVHDHLRALSAESAYTYSSRIFMMNCVP